MIREVYVLHVDTEQIHNTFLFVNFEFLVELTHKATTLSTSAGLARKMISFGRKHLSHALIFLDFS